MALWSPAAPTDSGMTSCVTALHGSRARQLLAVADLHRARDEPHPVTADRTSCQRRAWDALNVFTDHDPHHG